LTYDEGLAERLRDVLADEPDLSEIKMFGGLCFTIRGNMLCGIVHDDLMLRVGPDAHEDALSQPHTRPMDFAHRPMVGMIYVGPEGCVEDADLKRWTELALQFAGSLPAKQPKASKPKPAKKRP
jgi:TfoX/Sxy family transcriptional regulator of competence genes